MAEEFREYPKGNTRQLIDYNRFVSLTGQKYLVCLDGGVIEIAKYLLNSRGLYITTYYKELLDRGYNVPTNEEFEIVENAIAEANIDMSGCTDIVAELALIRQALGAMAQGAGAGCGECGGGSRGAGAGEASPDDFVDDGTNFPPSFDNRAQFDEHRCNQAYDIVNALINDLQGLAGIEYTISGNIPELIAVLVTVLLTPVPYDDIAYLVGLLLFTVIEYTFLVEFSSVVFDNRANLACILYNSEDASQAQVNFQTELDALVDGTAFPAPAKDFVKDVVHHLTPLDAINKLYSDVPTIEQDGDCSTCVEGLFFIDIVPGQGFAGELVSGDLAASGVLRSMPIFVSGATRQYLVLQSTGEPQDNYVRFDSVISSSGATNYTLDVYDDSDTLIHTQTETSLSAFIGFESPACKFFLIRDSSDFTSQFEIGLSFSITPF